MKNLKPSIYFALTSISLAFASTSATAAVPEIVTLYVTTHIHTGEDLLTKISKDLREQIRSNCDQLEAVQERTHIVNQTPVREYYASSKPYMGTKVDWRTQFNFSYTKTPFQLNYLNENDGGKTIVALQSCLN